MEDIVLEPISMAEAKTMDDFYHSLQKQMMEMDEKDKLSQISSRATSDSIKFIEEVSALVRAKCLEHDIPTEGNELFKNENCVQAFKYLVCNTNFKSRSLLSDDPLHHFMVDLQPDLSPYLFSEILLGLNFEDILVESVLHFPMDLCVETLASLPRCIDILEFDRELKLLISIITNAYMKVLIMKDIGTQSEDISGNMQKLQSIIQELTQKFKGNRFMKLDGLSKSDQYRRHGIIFKNIVRMARICLTNEQQYQELKFENLEKMYKLTFGKKPLIKLDEDTSKEFFTIIRHELVDLLLHKNKAINVDMYSDWMEYRDDENSSFMLQRGVGLECHFFIETVNKSEHIERENYKHLIACLTPVSCEPDAKHKSECYTLAQLTTGIRNSNNTSKECLVTLFKRYKEWDDSIIQLIDDYLHVLDKNDCLELVNNIVIGLDNSLDEEYEKSEYFLYLGKALALLDVKDLFEFSVSCILKFGCNESFNNRLNINNFSKFVTHNLPISSPRSLRVVLFYLSLKTVETLKILIKLSIEHSDYPNVSIGIDELKILLPILRIRTDEKATTLATRVLREICLEKPDWKPKKFLDLLQFYDTFCSGTEIVDQILVEVVASDKCSISQTRQALAEIKRFKDTYEGKLDHLIETLANSVLPLRQNVKMAKFEIEEPINLAFELAEYFLVKHHKDLKDNYPRCHSREPLDNLVFNPYLWDIDLELLPKLKSYSLKQVFGTYCSKLHLKYSLKDDTSFILIPHGSKVIDQDDVLRHLISRCTKREFLHYTDELLAYFGPILKWQDKTNIVDNIIRLTFETCLLFLEFPTMASPDILEFLLKNLAEFYSGLGNEFFQVISESTLSHVNMLSTTVGQTRIKEEFKELLDYCKSSDLRDLVQALQKFGEKATNLKTFQGCRSQKAIRLFLGYRFVNESLSKAMSDDELKRIFQKCFARIF